MNGIAFAEVSPTVPSRAVDRHSVAHAPYRDVGYAPQVVTFHRDDRADFWMRIHDGDHAAQIAKPFFTDIASDKQVDVRPQSGGLEHRWDEQGRGDAKTVITDSRTV